MANARLEKKINHYEVGNEIWNAIFTVISLGFLLLLTLNAPDGYGFFGWYLIAFQVLSIILKTGGWRSVSLSPSDSEYLIKHPYRS